MVNNHTKPLAEKHGRKRITGAGEGSEHSRREHAIEVLRRAMVNDALPQSVREASRDELERLERGGGVC